MTRLETWMLVAALGLAGCAAEAVEEVEQTKQALADPGLAPVPCVSLGDDAYSIAWDGTDVELMVADAWAECEYGWSGSSYTMQQNDGYLNQLRDRVVATITAMWDDPAATEIQQGSGPEYVQNLAETWTVLRGAPVNCNVAGTGERIRYQLSTEEHVPEMAPSGAQDADWQRDARRDMRLASVNGCLAQKLRNKSPGASGAAALLLTSDEQLELLNVVRDRAQLAVHYYTALLGFMNPGVNDAGGGGPYDSLRQDEVAARLNATDTAYRRQWGADYAGAIQLLLASTEELASLIARSRSADLPYPGSEYADTDAQRRWRPNSWQAKLRALLYGGDLFAPRSLNTFDGVPQSPTAYHDQDTAWLLYADTLPLSPQSEQLFVVARALGRLVYPTRVPIYSQAPECRESDSTRYDLTYEQTQRELQRRDCGTRSDLSGPDGSEVVPLSFDEETGACGGVVHDILGERYGILREHGLELGRFVASVIGVVTTPHDSDPGQACRALSKFALDFRGSMDYDAELEAYRLSKDFEFTKPDLTRVASLYKLGVPLRSSRNPHASLAQHGLPERHTWVGFNTTYSGFESGEQVRRMGSVAVLSRAAEVLQAVNADVGVLGVTPQTQFVSDVLGIVGPAPTVELIEAAVGETTARMGAAVDYAYVTEDDPYEVKQRSIQALRISAPVDDPVLGSEQADSGSLSVYLVPYPFAAEMAAAPDDALANGISLAMMLGVSDETGRRVNCEEVPAAADATSQEWNCAPTTLPSSASSDSPPYTLVAYRGVEGDLPAWGDESANPGVFDGRVRLLGSNISDDLSRKWPFREWVMSYGGYLNAVAERQLLPDPEAPYRPEYDGFGLPEGWVPPFMPEVVGSVGDSVPVSYYLDSARLAAGSASEAVRRAMDSLTSEVLDGELTRVSEEQRQAALEAGAERAKVGMQEATAQLCGADVESMCAELEIEEMTLDRSWYSAAPESAQESPDCETARDLATPALEASLDEEGDGTISVGGPGAETTYNVPSVEDLGYQRGDIEGFLAGTSEPFAAVGFDAALSIYETILGYDEVEDRAALADRQSDLSIATMKCQTWEAVDHFLSTSTRIAEPVREHLDSDNGSVAPLFSDYAGGTIQGALIEQWKALKAPDEKINYVALALDGAAARVKAANARIAAGEAEVRRHCSSAAMARAFAAGFSGGFMSGVSWTPGPLIAQKDRCADAAARMGPEIAGAQAEMAEATASVAAGLQGFVDAAAGVQQASATVDMLLHQRNVAITRLNAEIEIERNLGEASFQHVGATSFGLYRMYRDYDLWRARGMVEAARMHALIARRAVESHFVVDLPSLAQDEAFVVTPSSWANEVYEYDLSLPSAIGMSAWSGQSDVIAVNKVEDYVTNLELFVRGYAVNRPTAVARNEVEVLTLPGPMADEAIEPLGTDPEWVETVFPNQGAWQAYCENTQSWISVGRGRPDVSTMCDALDGSEPEAPTAMRFSFWLDPWGRLGGFGPAQAPYERRYNGRWDRLAVNLVGTGVLDCTEATDALECYGNGYVRYNLEHIGEPLISDYRGEWTKLAMPGGWIEGAKAVALERWLEPLVDGWSTPYISAAMRTEFMNRPLGGEYRIELKLGPHVRPERIQRVQLLVGSNYWVAQDGR